MTSAAYNTLCDKLFDTIVMACTSCPVYSTFYSCPPFPIYCNISMTERLLYLNRQYILNLQPLLLPTTASTTTNYCQYYYQLLLVLLPTAARTTTNYCQYYYLLLPTILLPTTTASTTVCYYQLCYYLPLLLVPLPATTNYCQYYYLLLPTIWINHCGLLILL